MLAPSAAPVDLGLAALVSDGTFSGGSFTDVQAVCTDCVSC